MRPRALDREVFALAIPALGALTAHQIAFQLFVFLALVLDAMAIAAQVLVGRLLGADRRARAHGRAAVRGQPVGFDRRSGVVPWPVA